MLTKYSAEYHTLDSNGYKKLLILLDSTSAFPDASKNSAPLVSGLTQSVEKSHVDLLAGARDVSSELSTFL